jgi:hypothetical protein
MPLADDEAIYIQDARPVQISIIGATCLFGE